MLSYRDPLCAIVADKPPGTRKQYATREEFIEKEIRPRLEAGESYSRMVADLGISKSAVYRLAKEVRGGAAGTGATKPPSTGAPSRPGTEAQVVPDDLNVDDRVRIRMTEAQLTEERARRAEDRKLLEDIQTKLGKLSKEPLTVEEHDGQLHVGCPNCGTSRDILPPARNGGGESTFDEVLSSFDVPHKGGTNAATCPNCRPKLDAKLKELGLELHPLDETSDT
jgi:hypothetical protein